VHNASIVVLKQNIERNDLKTQERKLVMYKFIFGVIFFVLVIGIAVTGNEDGRCLLVFALGVIGTAFIPEEVKIVFRI